MVGHRCNNRACCNPDHLYESNPYENRIDTLSYHKGVKIQPDDKIYILNEAANIDFSIIGAKALFGRKLAPLFNVAPDTIIKIVRKVGLI